MVDEDFINNQLEVFGIRECIIYAINYLSSIRCENGGYPARKSTDKNASITTTAVVCLMQKKAEPLSLVHQSVVEEDLNIITKNFDAKSKAWKIFGNELPSPWVTAFCIWSLCIHGNYNLDCVKQSVNTLLNWQKNGGWGITPDNENEILVTYMVTKALLVYNKYSREDSNIREKLIQTKHYFSKYFENESFKKLNVTDLALSYQALADIRSEIDHEDNSFNYMSSIIKQQAFEQLHSLISLDQYTIITKIMIPVKTGEWHTFHFHPAIISVIAKNHGNPTDTFKLLLWFKENFVSENSKKGLWRHFANSDETYTTALAVYALLDLCATPDYFDTLKEYIRSLETENRHLKDENSALKARLRDVIVHYIAKWGTWIFAIASASISIITGFEWLDGKFK